MGGAALGGRDHGANLLVQGQDNRFIALGTPLPWAPADDQLGLGPELIIGILDSKSGAFT